MHLSLCLRGQLFFSLNSANAAGFDLIKKVVYGLFIFKRIFLISSRIDA